MAESVISIIIKTKEVTLTTDAEGRVEAIASILGISPSRIINAICTSPSYGYLKIGNFQGVPYLWYFKDARTDNALASQTVKAKVYYI